MYSKGEGLVTWHVRDAKCKSWFTSAIAIYHSFHPSLVSPSNIFVAAIKFLTKGIC